MVFYTVVQTPAWPSLDLQIEIGRVVVKGISIIHEGRDACVGMDENVSYDKYYL